MESSASKCNRALPSAIEPICFGAQLRERYTLKSDIYQLSVLIAGPLKFDIHKSQLKRGADDRPDVHTHTRMYKN